MDFKNIGLEDYSGPLTAFHNNRKNSSIFLFSGDLGSGKTTMIKQICKDLGVVDEISSPTFSLVNEYRTKDDLPVYHFDLYRLKDLDEAQNIGITEYLDSGNLCLIEWPELILPLLEFPYFEFRFKNNPDPGLRDLEVVVYE